MFNSPLPAASDLPTTGRLVRSTVIALAVAAGLLVTVVMPSEYAVDPTGVGRVLGLQQMGEIKIALANEALADSQPVLPTVAAPIVFTRPVEPAPAIATAKAAEAAPVKNPGAAAPMVKSNKMQVNLKPGEGTEIKLEMVEGAKVRYQWTSTGDVNFDTHGEPYNGKQGYFHSYSKGKQVSSDTGEFAAKFDGTHGWFWRNRGSAPVTISLATSGEYSNVKQ